MGLINDIKQRPQFTGFIDNVKTNFLFDTGAMVTVISEKIFRSIPIQRRPPRLAGQDPALGTANGTPLHTRGRYMLPVRAFGQEMWHEFHVVSNLNTDAIVGIDFINSHHLSYDGRTRTLLANKETLDRSPGQLKTTREFYLPSGRATNISVHSLSSTVAPGSHILTTTGTIEYPALVGQPGLCRLSQNLSCKLQVVNSSHVDIRIPRGTVCGSYELIEDNVLQNITPISPQYVQHVAEVAERKSPSPRPAGPSDKAFIDSQAVLNVPLEWKEKYQRLIYEFHDVFSREKNDFGQAIGLKHEIHLKANEPVYRKQFKIPDMHRDIIEKQVKEWLAMGVVQPSRSRWNSPMFCVPKKDGKLRLVQDFRGLNQVSQPDKYSMKDVTECIGELGRAGSTLFSTLDLTSGFWQMGLESSSRRYTAFTVPGMGQFEWVRSPMGLLGCPASFQRLVELAMDGISNLIIYIDDLLVHTDTHERHLATLRQMFQRLRRHNLKVNLNKCVFGAKEVAYLGFRLTPNGVKPGFDKLKAIRDTAPPSTVKQVRGFLGLCNFFRGHVRNFAMITHPLTRLTCKDSTWRSGPLPADALRAFQELKSILVSEPIMAYPRRHRPYALIVDAATGDAKNPGGLGAILLQMDEKHRYVALAYASRKLDKHECNYSPFLLEMQAADWAMDHFRTHLLGRRFTLFSDHKPLEKLNVQHTKTLNRLQLKATEFDFIIKYKKGDEMPADFLSRNVVTSLEIQEVHSELNTENGTRNIKYPPLTVSPSEIVQMQEQDSFIKDLKQVLLTRTLPNAENLSPAQRYQRDKYLWLTANTCFVEHDVVYRKEVCNEYERILLVVPNQLKGALLAEAHGSLLAGHGGVFKTKQRLLQSYWWPNMDTDINKHIQKCKKCIVTSKNTNAPPVVVGTLPQCTAPNQRVHLDLFGPLRSSNSSKNYILAMTDAFTKYVELVALPNKEAETIAEAVFNHYICRHGIMLETLTDNGREFRNKLSKKLSELLRINQRFTTPYHPQCNAQVEIANKTIAKYLRSFVDESTLDWELYLMPLMFAYNTSVHSATKLSPHELTYGVPARTPLFSPDTQNHFYGESVADDLARRFQQVRQLAYHNNMAYRDAYLAHANKHSVPHRFYVGQFVYLRQGPAIGTNPKLSHQFSGPHKILRLIFDTDAEILLSNGRHVIVHVSRLKPVPPGEGRGISDKNFVANDNSTLPTEPHNSQTEETEVQRKEKVDQPTEATAETQPDQPANRLNGESEPNITTPTRPKQPENSAASQDRPTKKDLSKVKGKSDITVRRSRRLQNQDPEINTIDIGMDVGSSGLPPSAPVNAIPARLRQESYGPAELTGENSNDKGIDISTSDIRPTPVYLRAPLRLRPQRLEEVEQPKLPPPTLETPAAIREEIRRVEEGRFVAWRRKITAEHQSVVADLQAQLLQAREERAITYQEHQIAVEELGEANALLKQQQAENIALNLERQRISQKVVKERQQIEEWSKEKADIIQKQLEHLATERNWVQQEQQAIANEKVRLERIREELESKLLHVLRAAEEHRVHQDQLLEQEVKGGSPDGGPTTDAILRQATDHPAPPPDESMQSLTEDLKQITIRPEPGKVEPCTPPAGATPKLFTSSPIKRKVQSGFLFLSGLINRKVKTESIISSILPPSSTSSSSPPQSPPTPGSRAPSVIITYEHLPKVTDQDDRKQAPEDPHPGNPSAPPAPPPTPAEDLPLPESPPPFASARPLRPPRPPRRRDRRTAALHTTTESTLPTKPKQAVGDWVISFKEEGFTPAVTKEEEHDLGSEETLDGHILGRALRPGRNAPHY